MKKLIFLLGFSLLITTSTACSSNFSEKVEESTTEARKRERKAETTEEISKETTIEFDDDEIIDDEILDNDDFDDNDFDDFSSNDEELNTSVTIKPTVLYDKNNIKITAESLEFDRYSGVYLKLLIENNTDNEITVSSDYAFINKFSVYDLFIAKVGAGKKAYDKFKLDYLAESMITDIADIDIAFNIRRSDNYKDNIDGIRAHIPTSLSGKVKQEYTPKGKLVIDSDNIKIYSEGLVDPPKSSYYANRISLYIENNSDKDLIFRLKEPNVDDFLIDAYVHADILSGYRAIVYINIEKEDLKEINVEKLDNFKTSFEINEFDDYLNRIVTDEVELIK